MPPITDPALLDEIRKQQMAAGGTLAQQPAPYYTPPPPPMNVGLPSGHRDATVDPYAGPRFELSAQGNARAAAISPAQIRKENADAAKAEIEARKAQEAWDAAHPKGAAKIDPNAIGEQAIADLPEGEKDIVKGITQGRVPVTSLAISRNPKLFELTQRAFQLEPGTDLTTFQRRQAAFSKFMSNPNSPMLRVNQALQHLDRFYDSAHKLDNFHSGFFGAMGNYGRAGYMAATQDPRYKAFDADRKALATELAAAFQGSGQSALADREHWIGVLGAANSPESFDAVIKEATGLLAGRVEASNAQFKQAVGANADFYDLMSPEARKVYQKFSSDAFQNDNPADGKKELSTTTKSEAVPAGYQQEHDAFLAGKQGQLTVDEYVKLRHELDQKYLTDPNRQPLDMDAAKAFVDSFNQTGKTGKVRLGDKPLSEVEKLRSEFGQSGTGVALTSGLNAASFGLGDLAVGQEGRELKDLAAEKHPIAAIGGEVAGSIAPIAGLSKGGAALLAKLGLTPERVAALLGGTGRAALAGDAAANMAYGTARGFSGADEGEGGEGALEGAAGGVLGSLAGNAVTKGLTPVLKDSTVAALQRLKGVDMTTLQKLGLGRAEESLSGIPFAHGAREGAMESFNVDNANRALQNIKLPDGTSPQLPKNIEAGTDINAAMNARINEAYSRVRPKIFGSADSSTPAGKDFNAAIRALKTQANTPAKKAMFKDIEDAVGQFNQGIGSYNGDSYQAASMRLRTLMKDFATKADRDGDTGARDMARVAESVRKQMQTLITRHSPEAGQELKGVERAYAHSMRIEDASNRALAGNESVYSPAQLLTSIKKLDLSLNKNASARGKAFDQQYAQAASKVLGHGSVPKVSVRETSVMAGALGLGSTFVSPMLAVFTGGAGAGLYGPGVKRITQAILSGKRPSKIDNQIMRAALSDFTRNQVTGD